MEDKQTHALYPEPFVFADEKNPQVGSFEQLGRIFITRQLIYPAEGGIYRAYEGCLFSEKGLPFPEGIASAASAKRHLLWLLRFFAKHPVATATVAVSKTYRNDVLTMYVDSAEAAFRGWFYNGQFPRFYSDPCKQIYNFVKQLLVGIGISEDLAHRTAKVVMTMIEFDNAYRIRIQDLAGVCSQYDFMFDFPGAVKKTVDAFLVREPSDYNHAKLQAIAKIARVVWFFPKYRKALKQAFSAVDWDGLLFTEGDRYYAYWQIDYNSDGKSNDERREINIALHEKAGLGPPPMIEFRA